MRKIILLSILAIALIISGCAQQSTENTAGDNSNENSAAPAKDLKTTLSEMETKAYEAWKNKDGKYFEGFLSKDFVEVGTEGVSNRAAAIDSITGSPCDVKSFTISDENVMEIDENTALFYSKNNSDFTCGDAAGPEEGYAATLFVKSGDKWEAAFHQNVVSANAKNPAPALPPTAGIPKKEEAPATDEHSKALSAIENSLWEAFAKQEVKPFEDNLSGKFLNMTPTGFEAMDALKKVIADKACDIKSQKLADFKVTKISDTVSILTYSAEQDGKCGDEAMPAKVWAASMYVKDGDSWKVVYHAETDVPAALETKPEKNPVPGGDV